MEDKEIKAIIENILLVCDKPVTIESLNKLFTDTESNGEKIDPRKHLEELICDYKEKNYQIIEISKGYQLTTRFEFSPWIKKFCQLEKNNKLSQAALEALSIIAYKQPLTRAEVEDIRGVDSGGVLRTILEKGLIKIVGKKQVMGRPTMYGTSRKFLEYFGMKDLTDLPSLKEFSMEENISDATPTANEVFSKEINIPAPTEEFNEEPCLVNILNEQGFVS